MKWTQKLTSIFKRNENKFLNKQPIFLPTPELILDFMRYKINKTHLGEFDIVSVENMWFELDGCMSWNSVQIILNDTIKGHTLVYKAHQHADNDWKWNWNWRTPDTEHLQQVCAILGNFKSLKKTV